MGAEKKRLEIKVARVVEKLKLELIENLSTRQLELIHQVERHQQCSGVLEKWAQQGVSEANLSSIDAYQDAKRRTMSIVESHISNFLAWKKQQEKEQESSCDSSDRETQSLQEYMQSLSIEDEYALIAFSNDAKAQEEERRRAAQKQELASQYASELDRLLLGKEEQAKKEAQKQLRWKQQLDDQQSRWQAEEISRQEEERKRQQRFVEELDLLCGEQQKRAILEVQASREQAQQLAEHQKRELREEYAREQARRLQATQEAKAIAAAAEEQIRQKKAAQEELNRKERLELQQAILYEEEKERARRRELEEHRAKVFALSQAVGSISAAKEEEKERAFEEAQLRWQREQQAKQDREYARKEEQRRRAMQIVNRENARQLQEQAKLREMDRQQAQAEAMEMEAVHRKQLAMEQEKEQERMHENRVYCKQLKRQIEEGHQAKLSSSCMSEAEKAINASLLKSLSLERWPVLRAKGSAHQRVDYVEIPESARLATENIPPINIASASQCRGEPEPIASPVVQVRTGRRQIVPIGKSSVGDSPLYSTRMQNSACRGYHHFTRF